MTAQIALFLAAGFAGGVVNAIAGGAKLFVFPMLLAAGLPPLAANATGTVAVWPAMLPTAWVYREMVAREARRLVRMVLPALVGALCGALAMIGSSEGAFLSVIPALLILAVGSILLGDRLAALAQRYLPGDRLKAALGALLFAIGFYGGYFGAGMGFMLVAALTAAGGALREANATKNLFAVAINTVAVVPLALSGLVDWVAAATVLIGGVFGGYVGARLSLSMPVTLLRGAISVMGLALTAAFLLR